MRHSEHPMMTSKWNYCILSCDCTSLPRKYFLIVIVYVSALMYHEFAAQTSCAREECGDFRQVPACFIWLWSIELSGNETGFYGIPIHTINTTVTTCWRCNRISSHCHHGLVHSLFNCVCQPGPRLNIKTVFPMYGDSHVKDKTVVRPSYL